MKKKSIFIVLFLFAHIYFIEAQQIITDNTQQPNELIQNLVGDGCAIASNVFSTVNGSINGIVSYGTFDRGNSSFPLQNGIILSTGSVSSAGNNFIGEDLSEGEIDWPTDTDIQDILGIDQTLNATSIEFDFTSANNFIAFKYLFASDEYQQEYPCNFKDVFAVLIKRAGTADPYVNIALTPTTNMEVSTNTIHPNINGFCEAVNEDYFQGYNAGHTNFNGSTTVLTATSAIIPNETYRIKFVIADHVDERFDSAVFIEAEGFGNSVDLGADQTICGNDLTLDATINNPNAIYSWRLEGEVIVGQNSPTLEVFESGTYEVEILIPTPNGNCAFGDTVEIDIIPFQQAEPIEDFFACDPAPSDGIYDFDFSLKNDEIYANLPSTNYTISYHFSLEEAQDNLNPITGIYQNTDEVETIFARIESLSGDCLQLGSFDIIINSTPNSRELNLNVCNEEIIADFSVIGLSSLDFPVSNYEFNTSVSYYLTEEEAMNEENALSDLPDLSNQPPFFFGRVEDNFNNCPAIVQINLEYLVQPDLGIDRILFNACIDPLFYEATNNAPFFRDYYSLVVEYNIDDIIDEFEEENPDLVVQLMTIIGGNPRIASSPTETFSLPINLRFVGENCATPIVIEFHKNLLFNVLGDEKEFFECDDASNDNIVDFDLKAIALDLKNDYDINLEFYETEEDGLNATNAINPEIPYTVTESKTLYLRSSYDDCSHVSKVSLNINPNLNLSPKIVDYCGNTDSTTNVTSIAIAPLTDSFLDGTNIIGPVKLYLNEEDAENEANEIKETYAISGSQQIFYVRVTNFFTGCYDITTLQVNINLAIEASNPDPIIVCDDDQDGIATVNLEDVIPQLTGGSSSLNFTFFESYNNAVANNSPILNSSSYTTSNKELFIRGEIQGFECFTIFPLEVQIFANPELNAISDYINCETDLMEDSAFFFVNKDIEIINGQENMQVLYFDNETDAINRENLIDKTQAYTNTTNPQTIYVRLENIEGNSCNKIAPMQIEVKQAPIFTEPSDSFECDSDNTGLVTTDLNEKINEITANTTQNLSVTFHSTALNADLGSNQLPLNYTTTSNPQIIYTRIENIASGCFEVSTFNVNALSLPEVNYGKSMISCANNYNVSLEWNLTQIELDILDGRQYGTIFSYFETEAEAISDSNSILNPEAYNNTSNPQTIYLRVTNTVTGCFSTVPFSLILNSPPVVNPIETYDICENEGNTFDLSEINSTIVDNNFNVLFSYFSSEEDALAGENSLETTYTYTSMSDMIYARAEFSTTHCYAVFPFELRVNPLPIANQPEPLIGCDDDFDALLEFDLLEQNASILGFQNPNNFTITYHNSPLLAEQNVAIIEPSSYMAFDTEVITAKIQNIELGCYSLVNFSVIIHPKPFVDISDQVVCIDNLPLIVSAETFMETDSYLWSTNDTTPQIEITDIGSYYVTVTSEFGCTTTSTFNVTESESVTIELTETVDFSDPNNISVTISGIGNYLYILDDGEPQESNIFENVALGYHTITIIDLNGCAEVSKEVLVIDFPKFFTPNDDGVFDTWHIVGKETLPGTIVKIFDRYGKLLTQLESNTPGWDGTYKGAKMPTNDYWFTAIIKSENEAFEVKGHFTLKR